MRHPARLLASFASLLLALSSGCGEDDGESEVVDLPDNPGGSRGGGSGSGSGGSSPVTPRAGSSNGSGGASGGGSIPLEACPGLPLDSSEGQGGAGPALEAGGAAAVDASGAGGAAGAADAACSGVSQEAEAVPVDLLILMDRSQSMGFVVEGSTTTRWEALRDAVESFAAEPAASELQAGLAFFSLSGVSDDALDCDATAYAEPAVAIAPLGDVEAEMLAAMDAITPAGLTPTAAALEGAISYARSWARENPGRATAIVLVSDGYPTQCEGGPDAVARAAREAWESAEQVRTYAIGVGDVAKLNLDNYARAGGTGRALLTDSGDVTRTFVEALGNVTRSALSCEYQLPEPPEGMKLDTAKVQVVYTPASGQTEEVPSVRSLSDCARSESGGWYYDDPARPSKISVCPCTCAHLRAGRVDVRLGCKPRLGIR